jgi:hypothetical protein
MACGNCGNGLFRMFRAKDDLFAECTNCKSISIITVEKPQLKIEWAGTGTEGVLCNMTPTMNKT